RAPRRGVGPPPGRRGSPCEPWVHAPPGRDPLWAEIRPDQRAVARHERPLLLVRAAGASRPVPNRVGDARVPRALEELLRSPRPGPARLGDARVRGDGAGRAEQGPPRRGPSPPRRGALPRRDRACARRATPSGALAGAPHHARARPLLVRPGRRAPRSRLPPRDDRASAGRALCADLGPPRTVVPVRPRLLHGLPALEPLRAGGDRVR